MKKMTRTERDEWLMKALEEYDRVNGKPDMEKFKSDIFGYGLDCHLAVLRIFERMTGHHLPDVEVVE